MFHPCKITVVRRSADQDLANSFFKNPDTVSPCDRVKDNQEFLVSNVFEMPESICPWAWADIRPFLLAIGSGGSFPFLKEENMAIATCTDLFRPVIFKIERQEDNQD